MASSIGTAYVQIQPKATGIKQSLESELGKPSEDAGKSSGGKIAKFAKAAIVAAGIGKAISASIQEGGKLEQSIGGVETLYKKSADTVIKNADKAYRTAGLSANEYMEQSTMFAASLLQSLGGDTQAAAKYADMAIIDMSDNANKMGTDIESIQNAYQGFSKQNYTMLDNLKLGYGGTKEEMNRLLADAEKISGKKYDIGNLNDVYDAIHTIQGELDITGTTSKEAADTFQGSFAAMKSAGQNLLGNLAIGKNVESSMQELTNSAMTFFSGNLVPMLTNLFNGLPTLLSGLVHQGVPALLGMIGDIVPNIINWVSTTITNLGNTISTSLFAFADNPNTQNSGVKLIKGIIVGIVKTLPRLVASVLKAVPLIIAGLSQAVGRLISMGVTWMTEMARSIVSAAATKIKAAAEKVKDFFLRPINALKDKVKGIIDKIKGFFSFSISAPHIPLPHFKISPDGWKISDLLKGVKPSLSIDWYAKGGIVDGATLIGAGEAGAEAIVPLDKFWAKLDEQAINYEVMADAFVAALTRADLVTNVNVDGKTIARATGPYMRGELNSIDRRSGRKLGFTGA